MLLLLALVLTIRLSSRPYHCVKMKENFDERSELTLCEGSQKTASIVIPSRAKRRGISELAKRFLIYTRNGKLPAIAVMF